MSDNTKEAPLTEQKSELIYKLEDRPPVKEALFAAFQHLLAIFEAIITPPLIIAGALKLDLETTSYLISMSLLASGISTFIQCRIEQVLQVADCFVFRVPHSLLSHLSLVPV